MTRRIWKVDVPIEGTHQHELPVGAVPVHVACQHSGAMPGLPTGIVQVWLSVYDDRPTEKRLFFVVGTGHPVPDGNAYIGTGLDAGGALVWHVFEVESAPEKGVSDSTT